MKTIEEQAAEFSKFDPATEIGTDLGSYRQGLFEGYLAGHKAGFEVGCMKGAIAMQGTLDSDWHFTSNVNQETLVKKLTKKEFKDE